MCQSLQTSSSNVCFRVFLPVVIYLFLFIDAEQYICREELDNNIPAPSGSRHQLVGEQLELSQAGQELDKTLIV